MIMTTNEFLIELSKTDSIPDFKGRRARVVYGKVADLNPEILFDAATAAWKKDLQYWWDRMHLLEKLDAPMSIMELNGANFNKVRGFNIWLAKTITGAAFRKIWNVAPLAHEITLGDPNS